MFTIIRIGQSSPFLQMLGLSAHMTSKSLTKGEQYVKSGSISNFVDTIKSGTNYFLKAKVDASMKQEQRTFHVTDILQC